MNGNKIVSQLMNSNEIEIPVIQSQILCLCCRKTKFLKIFLIVLIILLIICIPIIILLFQKRHDLTESIITITSTVQLLSSSIPNNMLNIKWKQNGTIVAGTNHAGNQSNQLSSPYSFCIDDDDATMYIADRGNHRIVRWKLGEDKGEVVMNRSSPGHQLDQLRTPMDVILDKHDHSLLICDQGNRRVLRWSLKNQTDRQIIIADVACWTLTLDQRRNLYVCDYDQNEVRRWTRQDNNGSFVRDAKPIVIGLNEPSFVFVDSDYSVYISDWGNHRVLKWNKTFNNVTMIAGIYGTGTHLAQLRYPQGLYVDQMDNTLIVDGDNSRVTRWCKRCPEGQLIVGGNGDGEGTNQLNGPKGLVLDRYNNLYVIERDNHRIIKFDIISN